MNLAKFIDTIMLCYNPDIDALKAENLSDMAVRLLDGVSRRDVVKDLEDFRNKWRHYQTKAGKAHGFNRGMIGRTLELLWEKFQNNFVYIHVFVTTWHLKYDIIDI